MGSAIGGVLGAQLVKGNEPERAKALLLRNDWIRRELTARATAGAEFKIEEAAVVVETQDESIASVRIEMESAALAAELERSAATSSYRTA